MNNKKSIQEKHELNISVFFGDVKDVINRFNEADLENESVKKFLKVLKAVGKLSSYDFKELDKINQKYTEDNIKKWFELNDDNYHALATKSDATFSGLIDYIHEHDDEVFYNVYEYCRDNNYNGDEGEFETGAREDVTEELFNRFDIEWNMTKRWTIKCNW